MNSDIVYVTNYIDKTPINLGYVQLIDGGRHFALLQNKSIDKFPQECCIKNTQEEAIFWIRKRFEHHRPNIKL